MYYVDKSVLISVSILFFFVLGVTFILLLKQAWTPGDGHEQVR